MRYLSVALPTACTIPLTCKGCYILVAPADAGDLPMMQGLLVPYCRWLVSATLDGWLSVWDTTSWKCATKILAHHGAVNALAVSPKGDCIATGRAI